MAVKSSPDADAAAAHWGTQLLGISRAAAYRLAANGELPVRHLGGRVYVVSAKLLEPVDAA